MNKTIKRIITLCLAIGAFSIIEPAKKINITTIKAYASDDDIYLRSINVSGADSFSLITGKTTYKVDVSNSTDETTIRVRTDNDNDKVTIDNDSSPEEYAAKCFKKDVELNKGKNEFQIKVENGDSQRTYTLSIYRGGSDSTKYDDVYLNNIVLSEGEMSFSKDKNSYDINVAADVDKLNIKADPEDEEYTVTIDGSTVDKDDKFRKTVTLNKGQNEVYIEVINEDTDEERLYTLNIYRGINTSETVSGKIDNEQDFIYLDNLSLEDGSVKFTPTFNQKVTSYAADVSESDDSIIVKAPPEDEDDVVRINGDKVDSANRKRVYLNKGKNVISIKVSNEEYYDNDNDDKKDDYEKRIYTLTVYRGTSEGSVIKNTTPNVDINKDIKVNQWINNNGKWQYNDSLGNVLKNTWFFDKNYGAWYYLDEVGNMKTGWIQDGTGKWYYLYSSGAMAYNTSIDGYKLGSDGAWVK